MRKKRIFLFLAVAICLCGTACGAGRDNTAGSSTNQLAVEVPDKQVKSMKIRIKIGEKDVTATLNDGEAARDFASLLPLTLTLGDYNNTEKISDLPKRLSTEGAPAGSDPDVGTIAYYAPWGNLAIFYKDFGYSNGLVTLGRVEGGMELISTPGSLKATIELVK